MADNVQTKARVSGLAHTLAATAPFQGVDWDALVKILIELIPVIVACFRPDDGPQAQKKVADRWNEDKAGNEWGGYEPQLVKSLATRALNTAWKKERVRLTRQQAIALAIATLDDVRTGDPHQASLIVREQESTLDADDAWVF